MVEVESEFPVIYLVHLSVSFCRSRHPLEQIRESDRIVGMAPQRFQHGAPPLVREDVQEGVEGVAPDPDRLRRRSVRVPGL